MIYNQAQSNLYDPFEAFGVQPENISSTVSNWTTRTSLGSKRNEKVKTANESQPKSSSNI